MSHNTPETPTGGAPVRSSAGLGHTKLTADQIGELLVRADLSVLDDDLRKPWEGMRWELIHSDKLVQVQLCRLLRDLISATKESNESRNR